MASDVNVAPPTLTAVGLPYVSVAATVQTKAALSTASVGQATVVVELCAGPAATSTVMAVAAEPTVRLAVVAVTTCPEPAVVVVNEAV